jgi:hypothetical protein
MTISTEGTGANDRTCAVSVRDTAQGSKNQTTNRTGAGAIKALFRDAIKALTRRADDEPQPRRSRRGETDRAFVMAAKAIARRAVQLPSEAYAVATAFLSDTLDWLNLWHHDSAGTDEFEDDIHTDTKHLSHHL